MTYLSVKALRHYHDVGLLEPADIDPSSGYRHYSADQVATAQAIRRFRDLDMPLDQVRTVLAGARPRRRATRRSSTTWRRCRSSSSARSTRWRRSRRCSSTPTAPRPVDYRTLPATTALAIEDAIAFEDSRLDRRRLRRAPRRPRRRRHLARRARRRASTPRRSSPRATARWWPSSRRRRPRRARPASPVAPRPLELAATRVAVMLHEGPFDDLDQTYGALGTVGGRARPRRRRPDPRDLRGRRPGRGVLARHAKETPR